MRMEVTTSKSRDGCWLSRSLKDSLPAGVKTLPGSARPLHLLMPPRHTPPVIYSFYTSLSSLPNHAHFLPSLNWRSICPTLRSAIFPTDIKNYAFFCAGYPTVTCVPCVLTSSCSQTSGARDVCPYPRHEVGRGTGECRWTVLHSGPHTCGNPLAHGR